VYVNTGCLALWEWTHHLWSKYNCWVGQRHPSCSWGMWSNCAILLIIKYVNITAALELIYTLIH